MHIFRDRVDVEESGVECIKCKGSQVITISRQTRSADEMMSILGYCTDCKYKFHVS